MEKTLTDSARTAGRPYRGVWLVRWVAVTITAAMAWAGSAAAMPFLDFGIFTPTSGSVSYATAGGALVGSGIQVDNIVGLGTSSNSGVAVTCVNCFLNFTTGAFVGSSSTAPWQFGPGGSLSIVGGVDFNGDSVLDIPLGTTLMSGTFLGNPKVLGDGGVKVATGGYQDLKDSALLSFFGLPTNEGYHGAFNLQFWASGSSPGTFASSQVRSGDFINAPLSTPIPEPGTMLLLGSGLLAAGVAARRARAASLHTGAA